METIEDLYDDRQTSKISKFKCFKYIIITSLLGSLLYIIIYAIYVFGNLLYVNWKSIWLYIIIL